MLISINYDTYGFIDSNEDCSIFDFFSIAAKGSITKRIKFTATSLAAANKALDILEKNGQLEILSGRYNKSI